ncbi:TorD/DmsD family molecular chaperone [Massilia brevitalea]|uniref:TorD/DmsD family molecular chaperone n=1 Tax=Massilia brevitalea TaxID=442526 RepID=UPI002738973B|nr:molecular chaperone TorD family protein [Massilia brevitalea]
MQPAFSEHPSHQAHDTARAAAASVGVAPPLSSEDQARADLYALAARLLLAPPDARLLAQLGAADPILAEGGDPALERAWEKLVLASNVMDADAVRAEFDALFVSDGTPKINPYGSLYIAGFMNDSPLAELRGDLARFGIKRMRGVGEFEDHLGALCETMRVLIAGGPAGGSIIRRQSHHEQQAFFEARIAPWYERCLDDIAEAEEANYYCLVAAFVGALLEIEADAFVVEEGFDD